ncbi:hypothetical protein [Moraxella cuniculi]|uniref:Lipoprotein n=1 Tax=Moraxella cuniculi TaxID=34061 RepID=A0A3S4RJX1_9GAMM|nr:hypothetical protein [Moraxella cuniculi]VEG12309.1 Uncharacterised protein [Moraxella cuniculi]
MKNILTKIALILSASAFLTACGFVGAKDKNSSDNTEQVSRQNDEQSDSQDDSDIDSDNGSNVKIVPNYWKNSVNQGFSDYEISNADYQGLSIICNEAAGENDEHKVMYNNNLKLDSEWVDISEGDYGLLINDNDVVYVPESTNYRLAAGDWIELTSLIEEATYIEVYKDGKSIATFTPKNLRVVEGLSDSCEPLMYKDFS